MSDIDTLIKYLCFHYASISFGVAKSGWKVLRIYINWNMKNVTNVFVFYPLHYNSIKINVHFDDV